MSHCDTWVRGAGKLTLVAEQDLTIGFSAACADHQSNAGENLLVSAKTDVEEDKESWWDESWSMSFQTWKRVLTIGVLAGALAAPTTPNAWGQGDGNRKVKNKVAPAYPELARRMRIAGVVKVQITVASNGVVKDAKLTGGHPLLANAVLEAVWKWRYEALPQASTENLEFRFSPNDQ